jgi:hypothetical protein
MARNLKAMINCLNWLAQEEEEGRRPSTAKIAAARDPSGAKKGRGRRKDKGLTGGTEVSVAEGKRKKSAGRPLRGREDWVGGPLGRKVRWFPFSFFFFLFQTLFKTNLLNSNSNKTFQTFSQNFINFLNFTQATKNHAKPNNDAQTLVVSRLIKLN